MIHETPLGNKLLGIYRGKVIRHLPHGKLKVFIPSVYDPNLETKPDMLPEAELLTPLFAGSNLGNGVFSYPNIGSIVMCQFINGDLNLPIVIGATLGGPYAYGQYEHIYRDSIKNENNVSSVIDTNLTAVDHSSPAHLITAGKTHLKLYEDGRISAIVMTPTDVPVGVDYQTNEISSTYPAHNINTQLVMSNHGALSASTNDYINNIHSSYISNIDGRIQLKTQSPDVTCYVDLRTVGSLKLEAILKDSHAEITMKSNGNIIVDSTTLVLIHAKNIKIDADTQLDINTPICTINDSVAFNVKAPAINLDASEGSIAIKTKSNVITFFD